jgi:hypothetical protein
MTRSGGSGCSPGTAGWHFRIDHAPRAELTAPTEEVGLEMEALNSQGGNSWA